MHEGGERLFLVRAELGYPQKTREGLFGTPAVDLVDKGDTLVLCSEIPGLKKKDTNISVTENDISISGKLETAKEEKEGSP